MDFQIMGNGNPEDSRLALERDRLEVERLRPEIEARNTFADRCIQSLLLLNGGAAVALLAYIGESKVPWACLYPSLLHFGKGTALAVATACAAYVTQILFAEWPDERDVARIVRIGAMALGAASIYYFMQGIFAAAPKSTSQIDCCKLIVEAQ
ncbi:MAG: hypothetical protein ACT4OU_11785 [Hyphomicrobium sp.]